MKIKKKFVCVCLLLILVFGLFGTLRSQTFVAEVKASSVNLNTMMFSNWERWNRLLTRWLSTNGTFLDLYDYSRRIHNEPSNITLSGIFGYILALMNMYEQTGEIKYLSKLRSITDVMIEDSWFTAETDVGTIFYVPHYWYDGVDHDKNTLNVMYAGIVAVKLYLWTGDSKYKALADRIADESLNKLTAINNSTDLAWSANYYIYRDEDGAKVGVNRQAPIVYFYALYGENINATFKNLIPKMLHWQFRAQKPSGGFPYDINQSQDESRYYTAFQIINYYKAYDIVGATPFSDYITNMTNAISYLQTLKMNFRYLETFIVSATLLSAWRSNAYTEDQTYRHFVQTQIYIANQLIHSWTEFGPVPIGDYAYGWRWSQHFIGEFFASYPIPDPNLDSANIYRLIDYTNVDSWHIQLNYELSSSNYFDRPRLNTIYGVGFREWRYVQNNPTFLIFEGSGTPSYTITNGTYYTKIFHDFGGGLNISQYVYYNNVAFFKVNGEWTFEIKMYGANANTPWKVKVENGTEFSLNPMANSTRLFGNRLVFWGANLPETAFFIYTNNNTWTVQNQTNTFWLKTTVQDSTVILGRVYVPAIPNFNKQYLLSSFSYYVDNYASASQPLTWEQLNDAFKNEVETFSQAYWGDIRYETIYTTAISSEEPLLLMHNNPQEVELTAWSSSPTTLTFTVSAPSAGTSTTKIFVGDRGEPTTVSTRNGTLSWSYDSSTTILTVDVTHVSPAQIVVDWRIPGDVNSDGVVDVLDLARVGEAYGSTPEKPNWDENADLDWDNVINVLDLIVVGKNYGNTKP